MGMRCKVIPFQKNTVMKNKLYPVPPRQQTKSWADCFIAILFAGIFTIALGAFGAAFIAWFLNVVFK
jgi:hypothetical protein